MHTDDLQYELPGELIAQHPAARRGESQLMVVRAGEASAVEVGSFEDVLLRQLRDDDLVVANDSRVLHARLHVTRPGGGTGELLLLEPQPEVSERRWIAMARPARRLRAGMRLTTADGSAVTCVERDAGGHWVVELPVAGADVPAWLEVAGTLPLPPYITPNGQVPERYQTIYACTAGSVAAPTAGLHFDETLWRAVAQRCEIATVTLHVGAGTFLPVREGSLADHVMHSERFSIAPAADDAIRSALAAGRRVVAVGTTTTRVLESVYRDAPGAGSSCGHPNIVRGDGGVRGRTDIFIRPGHEWTCVGALLTNFHLPGSTLLALVMALGGEQATRAWYADAIARHMRFFSFGDAMFVHGPPGGGGL